MQQLLLPVMLGLLYFFMIRPQQRRAREQRALISRTSNGDRVVLTSGIYGLVLDTNGDVLKIGTSPDTYVYVSRSAIARRIDPSDELSPPNFMLASEEDIAAIPAAEAESSATAGATAAELPSGPAAPSDPTTGPK